MPGNIRLICVRRAATQAAKIRFKRQAARTLATGEGDMRTDDFRPSDNVEDDRQASATRGGGIPGGAGGLGIGTIIVIGLISWYFGIDPSVLLNGAQILNGGGTVTQQPSQAPPVSAGTPTDPTGHFVALVL